MTPLAAGGANNGLASVNCEGLKAKPLQLAHVGGLDGSGESGQLISSHLWNDRYVIITGVGIRYATGKATNQFQTMNTSSSQSTDSVYVLPLIPLIDFSSSSSESEEDYGIASASDSDLDGVPVEAMD